MFKLFPVIKIDRYTPTQSGVLQKVLMGIMVILPSYLGANSSSPFSTRVTYSFPCTSLSAVNFETVLFVVGLSVA